MWFSHASGIIIISACGNERPPSTRISSTLSKIAESLHFSFATGGLVKDGVLAVAILPDRVIDRAVFAAPGADTVVTANPGCLMQIQSGLRQAGHKVRVVHLLDLLDEAYRGA